MSSIPPLPLAPSSPDPPQFIRKDSSGFRGGVSICLPRMAMMTQRSLMKTFGKLTSFVVTSRMTGACLFGGFFMSVGPWLLLFATSSVSACSLPRLWVTLKISFYEYGNQADLHFICSLVIFKNIRGQEILYYAILQLKVGFPVFNMRMIMPTS